VDIVFEMVRECVYTITIWFMRVSGRRTKSMAMVLYLMAIGVKLFTLETGKGAKW
jgi:hypothetical protein